MADLWRYIPRHGPRLAFVLDGKQYTWVGLDVYRGHTGRLLHDEPSSLYAKVPEWEEV